MPEYNVLTEPWITVRDKDGHVEAMCIMDIIKNAHELIEITDSRPDYEFGIYKFMCTFLMDALKPETPEKIQELLSEGKFYDKKRNDNKFMDKVNAYIKSCEKAGVSFDLFDAKNPFMQEKPANWTEEEKASPNPKENKIRPAAYLDYAVPTGNNVPHFDHRCAAEYALTPAECMKGLCTLSSFYLGTPQIKPCINSQTLPLYMIAKGQNLFETLVCNMVPGSDYEHYDDPGPFWNSTKDIFTEKEEEKKKSEQEQDKQETAKPADEKQDRNVQEDTQKNAETGRSSSDAQKKENEKRKKELLKVSLLFGLTFPSVRLTLLPDQDGMVQKVLFAKGLSPRDYTGWRDPYVAYIPNGTSDIAIQAKNCDADWMPICSLYTPDYAAAVIRQFEQFRNSGDDIMVRLQYYGCKTSQAAYLLPIRGSMELPSRYIEDEANMGILKEILSYVDNQHIRMRSLQKRIVKEAGLQKKGTTEWLFEETERQFYRDCKKIIQTEVIPVIRNSKFPDQSKVMKKILWIKRDKMEKYIESLNLRRERQSIAYSLLIREENKEKMPKERAGSLLIA